MRRWAARLGALGDVVSFDYPYMKEGRKSPDRPPVLIAAHRAALAEARGRFAPGRPVVLAGKSMGGRIGCHVAVELQGTAEAPRALVCFGYPLRAASSGRRRDQVLRQLELPVLFLQGDRDPLCDLDDLGAVRGEMKAQSDLLVVEGGDHSLEIRKKAEAGRSQDDVDGAILGAIRGFFASLGLTGTGGA